jgi:hypothetical protein
MKDEEILELSRLKDKMHAHQLGIQKAKYLAAKGAFTYSECRRHTEQIDQTHKEWVAKNQWLLDRVEVLQERWSNYWNEIKDDPVKCEHLKNLFPKV